MIKQNQSCSERVRLALQPATDLNLAPLKSCGSSTYFRCQVPVVTWYFYHMETSLEYLCFQGTGGSGTFSSAFGGASQDH